MRNPNNDSPIGKIIMAELKKIERSQDWLSRQIPCSKTSISFIVKGRLRPSVELAKKIANVLDVDSELLIAAMKKGDN